MNANMGNKGDVPVLVDPRIRKSEFVAPKDLVVMIDDEGKPHTLGDMFKEQQLIKQNYNKLLDILMNK